MARSGLFVYGFVRASEDRVLGPIGIDQQGSPGEVRVLTAGGIGAVVSDAAGAGPAPPSRKNLGGHNRVVQELLASIIPVSFGQVVKSPAEIKKFMTKNRAAILEELGSLEGKVEMSLRVRWDVENIFEYFIGASPELAEARDQVFHGGATPSHAEKMEIGRLFERLLAAERTRHTQEVLDRMEASCQEIKVNPPKADTTVMDLVILVDRKDLPEFERKVYEMAEAFPNQYTFEFTGPVAPFSFVELELQPAA